MKAVTLQSTWDGAPAKTSKAPPPPVPVSRLMQLVSSSAASVIQHKSACACGGGCPSCQEGSHQPHIQTKLTISTPGDQYEQEADRVADQVMRIPETGGDARANVTAHVSGLQPQRRCAPCATNASSCSKCADEKIPLVQKKFAPTSDQTDDSVADSYSSILGSGQALDSATRAFMEPRFGQNFGQVRVHADATAAKAARDLGALAFTMGRDIVFGAGQFAPESSNGRHLLAHELTHVVQQGAASSAPTLQRYSHQDCTNSDLANHIWPADRLARQMVNKAIRVIGASPVDASVTALFSKYFMTATPAISTMQSVFNRVSAKFTANNYQYECEDDCSGEELGYVYGIFSDIHLCMNHLRGKANDCIARSIVHEFTHNYAGTDDNGYCKSDCGYSSCPTTLSAANALANADSYACFAYELLPMAV